MKERLTGRYVKRHAGGELYQKLPGEAPHPPRGGLPGWYWIKLQGFASDTWQPAKLWANGIWYVKDEEIAFWPFVIGMRIREPKRP